VCATSRLARAEAIFPADVRRYDEAPGVTGQLEIALQRDRADLDAHETSLDAHRLCLPGEA
jgi:hypothetical protein